MKSEREMIFKAAEGFASDKSTLCAIPRTEIKLFNWVKSMECNDGISLNQKIIREKAVQINNCSLEKVGFSFSTCWFRNFCRRYNINYSKSYGDAGLVDLSKYTELIKEIKRIMSNYNLSNIYNNDETALFWKQIPKGSYGTSTFRRSKKNMERITLSLFTNVTGTNRFKPIIIGKAKRPRCFSGNSMKDSFLYYSNKTAWMNSSIFKDILEKFDAELSEPSLLLLDNFSGHMVNTDNLNNLKLLFFPPNTTSKLQPLDQGIIYSLKRKFQTKICQEKIIMLENKDEVKKNISLVVAIELLLESWDEVENKTIFNCWVKSTIIDREASDENMEIIDFLLDDLNEDNKEIKSICGDLGYDFDDFEKIITEENILTKEQKGKAENFEEIKHMSLREDENDLTNNERIDVFLEAIGDIDSLIGKNNKLGVDVENFTKVLLDYRRKLKEEFFRLKKHGLKLQKIINFLVKKN